MTKKTLKNYAKQWVYPAIKTYPDFLIIGTQKGATTSLARYLEQHPQIIGNNSGKEVHYYDWEENYAQGWGWYVGCFPFKWQKRDRLTFDATPNYLYLPHVAPLIKRDFGSKIKMIVVLRNPVNRAYSAWQMYHSVYDHTAGKLQKIRDTRSFAQAIEEELNPETNTAIYFYDYINRGKYVEQLENYYQYFDQENFLIFITEKIKDNVNSVLDQICDFLEIRRFTEEEKYTITSKKYNEGKYQFEKTPEDEEKLMMLKEYFKEYNEKLYDLLGYSCDWE